MASQTCALPIRSEEHTSELQSPCNLVCRILLDKNILMHTAGHALAFINELEHPERVGINPQIGHEEMPSLIFAHGFFFFIWPGTPYLIPLTRQNALRY